MCVFTDNKNYKNFIQSKVILNAISLDKTIWLPILCCNESLKKEEKEDIYSLHEI